jgi:hypothetical protein
MAGGRARLAGGLGCGGDFFDLLGGESAGRARLAGGLGCGGDFFDLLGGESA